MAIEHRKSAGLGEWLEEVAFKSGLAEHSFVSGTTVIKPYGFQLWENIKGLLDTRFRDRGVQNASFPLFIPEKLLAKESKHVEGFAPEVAWVTQGGNSKLDERLAVRPTSETIMYAHYSNWIRSWRDLPMKINQWCNVVRWEFKHPKLFLRGREFLWQEGHPVFATQEEAEKDVMDALEDYRHTYEEHLAIPVTLGKKSESEKFAGAVYTTTAEIMMPDGKMIQGCTSHYLGQNFSKPFNITFVDKDKKQKFAHQNSWGFSTRSVGILVAMHGDDKGLVLPPRIAPIQVVIIPIYTDETKINVLKAASKLRGDLKGLVASIDDRDGYTPGWKFNEWEMRGVPVRIEIGPKDLEKDQVVLARRDTGVKKTVKSSDVNTEISKLLNSIQDNLFATAKKFLNERTKTAKNLAELKKHIEGNRVLVQWCGSEKCEEKIKAETGAKISCIPFDEKPSGICALCGKAKAKHEVFVAKSY
jgi:prolyl-tRNA synthetase